MRSWIAFLLCISVEIAAVSQKEVIVTMQTKRWTHILNDHFLSLTVTPEIALQLEDFSKTTMNMMRGLSPTMVRLGGPSTDQMKFVPEKFTTDNFTITEAQWRRLNQFIEDVNMHLIVCLNSKDRVHGVWESHDAVELIYSSDKNLYKLGWELGYESEKLQQDGVSGSQLGRDVARLKKILGDFPMYTDSPIIGPDMKSLSSPEQVRFLREYLEESADFLTAITWHPQFSSTNPEDEDVGHKFLKIIHEMDNQIWNRNNGLRSPIQPPPKKPIWLAESDNDEYTGKFADSLTWIKRLGAAARLGFPVIMKKMTATSLTTPTPDYWVSLLYKTLVGPAVMDVKYFAGTNRSSLQVFSHCAHVGDESGGVLPPNLRYTQGATVLYGLNLDDQETRLTVRGNMKEEAVHKYVLTAAQLEEEKEFSDEEEEEKLIRKKRPSPQKTLLNGKLLSLLPSGELPTISPVEMRPTRTLSFNIPGRSVFFFVLPDMKLKTCMSFTSTIQSPIEKVNTLEKGLNLKSSNLGSEEGPKLNFGNNNILEPRISNEGLKLNFAPVGNNNILESRLSNDVVNGEPWKPPSFGVGLRGRLPDGRLNRGLIGVPKPRVVLESSNRHGTIDRENVLQDHSSTYNLKPMGKTTENEEDFDKGGAENDMELITDNGRAITNTRFVMFSDDDWLSDFAKAQESVELARKAIAAFDEAKLYRDQQQESLKLPQNSFEEQIMNQKMSPARRRIYEALMKKNTSKEIDQGSKNSAVFINGSDDSKDEKVYNRERRDNMIHESTFQSIEESSAIDNKLLKSGSDNKTDNQTEYTTSNIIPNLKSNNTVNTTSNIMPISKSNDPSYKTSNIMSLIRSNDIVKITPIQNNRTLEETPNVNNSSIVKPLENDEIGDQNISVIQQDVKENSGSIVISDNQPDPKNIEIDEMVLKGDSKEESNCFGLIESDLKVVTENNTEDNDEILKQKAERELNNYFEDIRNGEVSLDGIDESGESMESYDGEDLQPHTIVLENVHDKSCKASNKSTDVSNNSEILSLDNDTLEEVNFDSESTTNQEPSTRENINLQTTDLPEEVVLSENDRRADRGRREMFGSPFNYYNSRYNAPNQLTLREIKELIDELAARKRELNYVMLNQRKTPEQVNNFEESISDHTEIYEDNDSSTGPMRITIEDTFVGTESPQNDYGLESANEDLSNVRYSIVDDETKLEQTNRLYRQPQTDKINVEKIEGPEDINLEEHRDDSVVGAPLISKPNIESSSLDVSSKDETFLGDEIEPGKVREGDVPLSLPKQDEFIAPSRATDDVSLSVAREKDSGSEKPDDKVLEKTVDSMDGDVHLTEVNNAPESPATYSKLMSIGEEDEKSSKIEKGAELGSVKSEKVAAPISTPKISATQLRIEALRKRILENRRKLLKSSQIPPTLNKSPDTLKKAPIVKSNAADVAATPAIDDKKVLSRSVGEEKPAEIVKEIPKFGNSGTKLDNEKVLSRSLGEEKPAEIFKELGKPKFGNSGTEFEDEKVLSRSLGEEKPTEIVKEIKVEKSGKTVDEKIDSGYVEEGAPTCKSSRAAPYVEGMENWIDRIERDSEETVRQDPEDGETVDKQKFSTMFSKIDLGDKSRKIETQDQLRKIDILKSNRIITGTNKLANKMSKIQIASSIIKNQGIEGLQLDDIDSPFIIIPTSYAIMPIKSKGSRNVKNVRGYRSYPMISDENDGDELDDDSPVIGQEVSYQDMMKLFTELVEDDGKKMGGKSEGVIPQSFPLMVDDPEFTESYIENYGREKRSPDEAEGNSEKMLNRGLLNIRGLNRGFRDFRANFKLGENSKLQSLAPKLSLEEIRSKALTRFSNLRESLKNARLKTPIKSRETRAISDIEGRAKPRSAITLSDDMETNEIPKRRGEYIYEPKVNDRFQLSSAEFEKKMNGYKTFSRSTPVSSRKNSMIHLDDIGREKQVSPKEYKDNDYLVERMSMTDRAVVGLKHSVEELENTAKEILDKFRGSDYSEERKKPSLSNILQNTFRIGRPKEPKRTGALAFLNPIIDLALKFMRTLGIIS